MPSVITIPSFPPAPQSIEFDQTDFVAMTISPFTGQQQIQDWQANIMGLRVIMPPMTYTTAQPWIAFLRSLVGMANTFQFSSAFTAAYANDLGGRFWRLKSNDRKWVVSKDRVYLITFECREAK